MAIETGMPRWDESQASAVPIPDFPIVHSIVAMKTDKELLKVSMIPQSIGVAWAQRRKSHCTSVTHSPVGQQQSILAYELSSLFSADICVSNRNPCVHLGATVPQVYGFAESSDHTQ